MPTPTKKQLVIVESPAKARTIEKYLGSDYIVKSSMGHIRDLPKKGMSIDIENSFAPNYEVTADKKKTVAELRKLAKEADTVWLASDEDREGEAIAWHLCEALKLDVKKTKRIVFHEITKSAILEAVKHPRTVNMDTVMAQQARRILDRLVGYELSPVLWRKVQPGLSAGRVQSVAVRLIVDKERELEAFASEVSYKIMGEFTTVGGLVIDKAVYKDAAKSLETAEKELSALALASFKVENVKATPTYRNPSAPFTTSTLQQEAARKIGYAVKTTMRIAQKLYEAGHITYMRTDSTNLSGLALADIKNYVESTYGEKYSVLKNFKTKNSSAQEAHEAIRPTSIARTQAGNDEQEKRLYQLIWSRTVASQMSKAELQKTTIDISNTKTKGLFVAEGEVVVFDGFLKAYATTKQDVLLPKVTINESLTPSIITATETYSRGPARYSEASLVRVLEELGIGRPSTYAPTISTIQDRGYIEKGDVEGSEKEISILTLIGGKVAKSQETIISGADKNKLLPTHTAEITTDFLAKYFAEIVDFDFTATAEKQLDNIADGTRVWSEYIQEFYDNFHPKIALVEGVSKQETSKSRLIGTDPKSGRPVYARYGRFGPMLQIGEATDEEKPKFAQLPTGTTLNNVELEGALTMFTLPRTLGQTKTGEDILANNGRFGPYVQIGKQYVSIKPHEPLTITLDEALEAIANKAETDKDKYIATFDDGIQIIKGLYGPYITNGKVNAKIPKGTEPATLTHEQCKELIAAAPPKSSKRRKIVRKKK
jgi:DNA topoisomerase I